MVEIEIPQRNIYGSPFDIEKSQFQQIFNKIAEQFTGKHFDLLIFLKNDKNNVASYRSNQKLKLEHFINPSYYQTLTNFTQSNLLNTKDSNLVQGKNAEIELGIRPFYSQMNKLLTQCSQEMQKRNAEAEKNIIIIDEKPIEVATEITEKNTIPIEKKKPQLQLNIPQQQIIQQLPQNFNMPPIPSIQPLQCPPSNFIPSLQTPYNYPAINSIYPQNYPINPKELMLKKLIKKEKTKQKKFRSKMKKMMKAIQLGFGKSQIEMKQEYNSDEEKEENKFDNASLRNIQQQSQENNNQNYDMFQKFLKFKEFKNQQNQNLQRNNYQMKDQIRLFQKHEGLKSRPRDSSQSTKQKQQIKNQSFTETQSQSTKIGNDFAEPIYQNNQQTVKQPEEFFDFLHCCEDNNQYQFQDNL